MMDLWNYAYTTPLRFVEPVRPTERTKRLQKERETSFQAVLRREYHRQIDLKCEPQGHSWLA